MPIIPENPISIPAQTLDKYWVRSCTIDAPTPNGEVSATIDLLPYNESGDVDESQIKVLRIKNIMAKIAENPGGNLAQTMYLLLAAVNEEYTLQEAVIYPEPQGD